ncbi:MAG: cation:proton antiporter, partial [Lentisphaerae bacterium]|nr:cation:proton antiporter [Lentisphaerota bacterium]
MLQRTCAALLLVFLVLISVPVAHGQSADETPSTALSFEQANGARPVFSAAESDFEPADKAASPEHGDSGQEGHGITHLMMMLILQLAVIIIAAKMGGYLVQRFLHMPSVLGELASGMLIGPFALGGMIRFPGLDEYLFANAHAGIATSAELYGIATLASIILLFLAGLETDLAAFIRYSVVGSFVGLGGLLFAFVLGDLCAVFWPGNGIDSFMDPAALFLGVISVATSVGITARILAEKRKMSSPEGVTILAGAVFDDVLGIITLAIVTGMADVSGSGGAVNWGEIGLISLKAVGFFVVVTALGLIFARKITAAIKQFRSREIMVATCFGLALLLAGLAEMAGLAMIIGAYIMGLALSRTDLA